MIDRGWEGNEHDPWHQAHCQNCGATGPYEDTYNKAIDAWNKRYPRIVADNVLVNIRAFLGLLRDVLGVVMVVGWIRKGQSRITQKPS
jgi:hypothetical protein